MARWKLEKRRLDAFRGIVGFVRPNTAERRLFSGVFVAFVVVLERGRRGVRGVFPSEHYGFANERCGGGCFSKQVVVLGCCDGRPSTDVFAAAGYVL
ncbi:MAG: hypothetical protein ABFC77_07905 [Thermoguttaceae bacterium]